jgi:hypothetical protein
MSHFRLYLIDYLKIFKLSGFIIHTVYKQNIYLYIMKDENKVISKIIAFSLIFLIVGGVAGYFVGKNSSKSYGNFRGGNADFTNGNFQVNDSVRAEIASFFDNTQDSGEISTYCQNNFRYCMEYCNIINPSDTRCSELIASFRGGMPTR